MHFEAAQTKLAYFPIESVEPVIAGAAREIRRTIEQNRPAVLDEGGTSATGPDNHFWVARRSADGQRSAIHHDVPGFGRACAPIRIAAEPNSSQDASASRRADGCGASVTDQRDFACDGNAGIPSGRVEEIAAGASPGLDRLSTE